MFIIDNDGSVERVKRQKLEDLELKERTDLQEWIIKDHRILGEDEELLIVTSEYSGFENTLDRLDILALDPKGCLVVIELKRDKADKYTDLQAIKYASYCSTLTAREIQEEYREFKMKRGEGELSADEIGKYFANFLEDGQITFSEEGWAEFDLDNRPRIILAAGGFGLEVTSPVMWLSQEFDVNISCVRLSAYERDGEYLIHGNKIIPVPEAEEFMTRRQEKEAAKRKSLRPRKQAYLDLFTKISNKYSMINSDWNGRKPLARNAYGFNSSAGDSGLEYIWAYRRETKFGVELYIDTNDQNRNKEIFSFLKSHRDDVENEFEQVTWDDMTGSRAFRVRVSKEVGYAEDLDEAKIQNLVEWGVQAMDRFRNVIEPQLENI